MRVEFIDCTMIARERLKRFSRKAMRKAQDYYLIRLYRALRWKYLNNGPFRDVVDASLVTFFFGTLIASLFGMAIVEFLRS